MQKRLIAKITLCMLTAALTGTVVQAGPLTGITSPGGYESNGVEESTSIGEGWISLDGLTLKFGLINATPANSRFTELYGAFYIENNDKASIVYWVKDMEEQVFFYGDWEEKAYSGIRMKKVNGKMYFYLQDLYARGIDPYHPTVQKTAVSNENDESITIYSLNRTVKLSQLYAVNATGAAKGYKQLKGFPGEDKYIIYFSGTANSYCIKVREVNPRSNEKVTWSYKGKTYKNTREQCYAFFSQTTIFQSRFGVSNKVLSMNWFKSTFKNVYDDYLSYAAFTDDAQQLVDAYLSK